MNDKYKNGVYRIINTINGKFYIGSSSNKYGITRRFIQHKFHLNRGTHVNKYLQSSWDKYGKEVFVFEILEVVDKINCVIEREQYYLDFYKTYNQNIGYNICKIAGSSLGLKHSEETKSKISFKIKGKYKGVDNPMYKTSAYDKWVKELGVDEANEKDLIKRGKLSTSHKNKKHSEVTKNKISYANSGEKSSNSKLTNEIVNEIRVKYVVENFSLTKLSEEYGVSITCVFNVVKNKTYKNIEYNETVTTNNNRYLGDKIRCEYKNSKVSYKVLSNKYNISITQINRIINNKIYN